MEDNKFYKCTNDNELDWNIRDIVAELNSKGFITENSLCPSNDTYPYILFLDDSIMSYRKLLPSSWIFDTVPILTARPDYTTKARKIRRLYTNSHNKEEAINELKEFVHGLPDKGYRNSVYTPNDIW